MRFVKELLLDAAAVTVCVTTVVAAALMDAIEATVLVAEAEDVVDEVAEYPATLVDDVGTGAAFRVEETGFVATSVEVANDVDTSRAVEGTIRVDETTDMLDDDMVE